MELGCGGEKLGVDDVDGGNGLNSGAVLEVKADPTV